MDSQIKQQLDEILALTKQNNAVLVKMRQVQKWSNIMRVVYWVLIIGVSVGAYYLVQPFIDQYLSIYQGNEGLLDMLKNTGTGVSGRESIQSLLESIR